MGLPVRIIHLEDQSSTDFSVKEKVEGEQGMLAPEISETDIKSLSYTAERKYNNFFTDKAEVSGYSSILLHLWRVSPRQYDYSVMSKSLSFIPGYKCYLYIVVFKMIITQNKVLRRYYERLSTFLRVLK